MIRIHKPFRHRYFLIGAIALGLSVPAIVLGLRDALLPRWVDTFNWQVTTGSLLVTGYIYQLQLLFARLREGRSSAMGPRIHRIVGCAMIVVFLFHALSLGYGLTSWIVILFIFSALSGLLSRDVIKHETSYSFYIWVTIHVATGLALMPLIALHAWVAIAYK